MVFKVFQCQVSSRAAFRQLRPLLCFGFVILSSFQEARAAIEAFRNGPLTRAEKWDRLYEKNLADCRAAINAVAKPLSEGSRVFYSKLAFRVFRSSPRAQQFLEGIIGRRLRTGDGLSIDDEFLDATAALVVAEENIQNRYRGWLQSIEDALDPEEKAHPELVADSFLNRLGNRSWAKFFPPLIDSETKLLTLRTEFVPAPPEALPIHVEGGDAKSEEITLDETAHRFKDPEDTNFRALPRYVGNLTTNGLESEVFKNYVAVIQERIAAMTSEIVHINSAIKEGRNVKLWRALLYLRKQRVMVYLLAKLFWVVMPTNHEQGKKIQELAREIFVHSIFPQGKGPLGTRDDPFPGLNVELTAAAEEDPSSIEFERNNRYQQELIVYPAVRATLDEILNYSFK